MEWSGARPAAAADGGKGFFIRVNCFCLVLEGGREGNDSVCCGCWCRPNGNGNW